MEELENKLFLDTDFSYINKAKHIYTELAAIGHKVSRSTGQEYSYYDNRYVFDVSVSFENFDLNFKNKDGLFSFTIKTKEHEKQFFYTNPDSPIIVSLVEAAEKRRVNLKEKWEKKKEEAIKDLVEQELEL